MLDLPWGIKTGGNIDLAHARKVLDKDHYGMREIKDRLLEYLAVVKHKGDLKSPILCLVGPPGAVSYTHLATAIKGHQRIRARAIPILGGKAHKFAF